jgi:hypothetical protein
MKWLLGRFIALIRWPVESFITVPFYVAGVVPNTSIGLYTQVGGDTIVYGKADENGEFRGRIPRRFVGKTVYSPINAPGFLYDQSFEMVVQPWGLYRAIRLRVDRDYIGKNRVPPSMQVEVNERFIKAEADVQYAARQEINRTIYFWFMILITGIVVLIKWSLPTPYYAFLLPVAGFFVKALLVRRALGLAAKPHYK